MIKVTNINVYNFENALRGMRNALQSWHKSDSYYDWPGYGSVDRYITGKNDMELALRLVKSGSSHRKFLRQIFVSMDITAPDYFFKEYDTYKIGTTANSTSTMHRLTSRLLTQEDFSVDEWDEFNDKLLIYLNVLIEDFQRTKDKKIWRKIIQTLPMSFNYLRTCSMNYEVLRNMYFQRRSHRLSEWREFFKIIETLPYSEFITIEK